ncbi:MAG: InlB B-repeat-containing protein [Bacilli bacterium]|nr:InlB B-repeat-containing protein [Bacilli bacterium]
MKQRHSIFIPILALSFLVSCNSGSNSKSRITLESQTSYTVSFNSKGGSSTPEAQIINAYEQASEPTNKPTKEGFNFGGWYTDEAATEYKYDFTRPVISDLTLYANWEDARKFVTVTFDATENGKFGNTSRYLALSVPLGTKVCSAIKIIKDFEPISDGKVFACYSYKDNVDTIIDYRDVVNSDITLEANYLDGSKPYTDLDEFSWNFIKQVAVTKNDISKVFALGATKTIDLYNQPHKVRIIGFNHDILTKIIETEEDICAGLTFEFANLITNEDGTLLKTFWNEKISNKSDITNVFIGSTFYTLLNGEDGTGESGVFSKLRKDLKDVTQSVTKKVGQGGETEAEARELVSYDTRFFPLACAEIQRESESGAPADEGKIYQYYDKAHTETLRAKAPVGKTQAEYYWLRSPFCSTYDYYAEAHYVNTISRLFERAVCETDQVHEGIAIAPAFCI